MTTSSTCFTRAAWTLGCSLSGIAFASASFADQGTRDGSSIARPGVAGATLTAEKRGVRIASVTVPPSVGERTRDMLRAFVARTLSEEKLDAPRTEYSVSVSLLQLRRYVGPDDQQPTLVCILDVALHDARGALVGSLRGRGSGPATDADALRGVLEVAVRATFARLPDALMLADKAQRGRPAPTRSAGFARR